MDKLFKFSEHQLSHLYIIKRQHCLMDNLVFTALLVFVQLSSQSTCYLRSCWKGVTFGKVLREKRFLLPAQVIILPWWVSINRNTFPGPHVLSYNLREVEWGFLLLAFWICDSGILLHTWGPPRSGERTSWAVVCSRSRREACWRQLILPWFPASSSLLSRPRSLSSRSLPSISAQPDSKLLPLLPPWILPWELCRRTSLLLWGPFLKWLLH